MDQAPSPQESAEKRRLAQSHQHHGDYRKAVETQIELINALGGYAPERAEDMHLLGLYLFQLGDIPAALTVLKLVHEYLPQEADIAKNVAICELKLGQVDNALRILKMAVEHHRENFEIRDVFAHAAGQTGNLSIAREQGRESLRLKHKAVAGAEPVNEEQCLKAVPFDPLKRNENIIAFSLWGKQAKYLDGAVRNAMLAPDIYPSWQCRFYVDDSVPLPVIEKLRQLGASIVNMPPARFAFEGLFWRFLVADDSNVSRYIVRDCDAIINIRERAAVDIWCQSDKCFHVMRDYYSHTELILAGLWGGTRGALPNMRSLIDEFVKNLQLRTRIIDQIFLRERIWPRMQNTVVVHDSQFSSAGSLDFPALAVLPPGAHVGQDRSIFS